MKTLSKQTLPDSLQNFMLGFKLRFYRRIQIAMDNLNSLMAGALEGMAMSMTSGTLEYDVYWCHIVMANNVKSIRGKSHLTRYVKHYASVTLYGVSNRPYP